MSQRQFDFSRIVPYPSPRRILEECFAATRMAHELGLSTLEGCKAIPRTIHSAPHPFATGVSDGKASTTQDDDD